jgi:glycosyltransferase involved in cell wall biosynthesis
MHGQTPFPVAVVHDWLVSIAGGERVLKEILACYPEADLFALVDFLDDKQRAQVLGKRARTTFIQRLPRARTKYRSYLPLMPLAVEQLDLSAYALVISSSHAVAKGVITGPDQVHISYVHSPVRYAWDLQHSYLKEAGLTKGLRSFIARAILHYIRLWDSRTSNGVDHFVANSAYIGRRIYKVYRRDSEVIHPPVELDRFAAREEKEEFYLTASRMVPYKRIPLIAEAFSRMPQRRLLIAGDGPEMKAVRAKSGPNVEILGYQSDQALVDLLGRAKAFVFAAEEDFGIAPLEAQACGTPVIAYGKGGALESLGKSAERTCVLFPEQTPEAIIAAVEEFEGGPRIEPAACRRNAERFSPESFRTQLTALVDRAMQDQGR